MARPVEARRRARPGGAPLWLRAAGVVVAFCFAFPGAYLVWRNFTEGADPLGLLFSPRTLGPLGRTLRLAVGVSLAASAMGTTLAWLTARTDLPGRRFWRVVLPVPLVLPTFIGAAAFIRTFNPGGLASDLLSGLGLGRTPELRGFFGAWLVLTLFTYPYVYLPVAARLRQLPGALEESARLLGDTAWQTFRRICLPQMTTAIGAGTLLVFLYTVSDFGAVQLMRYDTLTRAIHTYHLANPTVALALSLLLLAVAAAVVAAERLFSRDSGGADSKVIGRPVVYRLGRLRIPAVGFVAAAAAFGVGAPLAALLDWSVEGLLRVATGGRPLTIGAGDVAAAAWNTASASAAAAVVAVAAVLPVAYLVGRYRSRTGAAAHATVISTFALPGILIALSMLFWTLRSDFFGALNSTMALLIFAYVVRFGSLAMGITVVAVQSVPAWLHDAARTLKAGPARRFATVDLPIMGPGLVAATGLVLLSVMKELPISLLISPLGFSTLATRTFDSFRDAFVAEAGIMAAALVLLSLPLSWLLVLRRSDRL